MAGLEDPRIKYFSALNAYYNEPGGLSACTPFIGGAGGTRGYDPNRRPYGLGIAGKTGGLEEEVHTKKEVHPIVGISPKVHLPNHCNQGTIIAGCNGFGQGASLKFPLPCTQVLILKHRCSQCIILSYCFIE